MSLETFARLHVAFSLVAIVAGLVVAFGMLARWRFRLWTAAFLGTTMLTNLTGFLLPFDHVTPGIGFGVFSLLLLAGATYALSIRRSPAAGGSSLTCRWRIVYVVGAMASLYLEFVVLIVQSFQKVDALHALASTQSELPFLVTQRIAPAAFMALGWRAVARFEDR